MAFRRGAFILAIYLGIVRNVLYDLLTQSVCSKHQRARPHVCASDVEEGKVGPNKRLSKKNSDILHFLQQKQVLHSGGLEGGGRKNPLEDSSTDGKSTSRVRSINFHEVEEYNSDSTPGERDCKTNPEGCRNSKVKNFVNLMKGIGMMNTEKKEDNMEGEKNIYNDEHNTVVIYDGVDEKKDLYNKYKEEREDGMSTVVIQGTEYLGVGYDFIFGNPIGDPFLKVDPGYRDSIIKLTYPKSDFDYPDTYVNINPNGSYVRNEISCNRSENESEISTMSEYTKELSVDASIGASYGFFGSFSASTGYTSVSNTISKKKFRLFMLKSYCFKYMASLSQYSQWKLSDPFVRAISLLPSYFNSLQHDGTYCTAQEFRDNRKTEKCGKSVEAWMYFFKNFGTHVSTLIHLGGKITQQIKISKNEYKAMSEKGISVSVSASAGFGLFKAKASTSTNTNEASNEENTNSSMEKETVIIGGDTIYDPNNPKNFEKWAKSIKDNPMPIKGEYEPLSRILPIRLTTVYDEALQFYISVNVPLNLGQITDDEMRGYNVKEQLMKSRKVFASGTGLVVLECEEKKNFILGFSLSVPNDFTVLKDFYINTCDEDSDKCYSKMSDNAYNYLFAMCNEEMIPFLEQKVKSGTGLLTLECSEKNQVILFGFGISVLNSNDPISISIYPCKYGKSSCSMQGPTDQSAVGLWVVCGHEESQNSKFSMNVRKMAKENVSGKKKKHIEICPQQVLFNLIFEFTRTPLNKRNGQCFTVNGVCPKNFHVCSDKKHMKGFNYYSVSVY
ncbi:perforin-like protein 3 [Plasmodium knowlesi strain H]|uniref:Perforin-like protein 3 n=3 Tax=Plasmodium knowlesi TaxID=5850 RepID=A0A5K1TWI6_PLAKH|nr:membrane attack ookinete protein, putative [Plasmodium knowlesi strain H]OTN67281.1 putative MAC/perforin [Plasmodium knowlesi]CAA9987503.1 membrane attack ookinete protein, putative [Plasmodium knowlesi strain H]SBO23164.1 perforin-like protein 3 [Plasmodium knowlesi strain H]SBO23839.1 perforin-like protein 3 [Plasmodium knowlesi strain H]VVS76977.1 membrane attack ookinete protein, putative [Plasmodium knowlesi strain H]|eukprot:XP_002258504.1 MAC/perforin, putative [Plasmodium knowlesi strain H]